MAPYTTYFNYLPVGLAGKARKVYNAVVGADFNRDACEEAQKHPCKLNHHDLELNEEFDAEEEWTGISQSMARGSGIDHEEEEFIIREYHGRPRQLSFKLSEKAAEAACEAAGVSREYLGMALKYVALEVSRDIGWITHCRTAIDALRAVKTRFPVLEDMQKAYSEGSMTGQIVRSRSNTAGEIMPLRVEDEPMTPGQIRDHLARAGGAQVYDPEVHAGVELVPVMATGLVISDDEDDDADDEEDEGEESVDADGFRRVL